MRTTDRVYIYNRQGIYLQPTEYIFTTDRVYIYNRQGIYLQPSEYIFTTDRVYNYLQPTEYIMYIPTEQWTQATE